ncbi:MAG: hypothetical protein ACREBU_05815 [Nitrososphaera sp.]
MRTKTAVGVFIIIGIAITVGIFGAWKLYFNYPPYHLGVKEQLLSDLGEYFGREPDSAVRIGEEFPNPAVYERSYRYELISTKDSKSHGNLTLSTYDDKVMDVTVWWTHGDDVDLRNSGDLIMSGIADNTIPDWQKEDGQPNRNVELFKWIDLHLSGEPESRKGYTDRDLSERRVLTIGQDPVKNEIFLNVFIQP